MRFEEIRYPELSELTYSQVNELWRPETYPPYSVHMPLNLPRSRHLVFMDAALSAYVLPVAADVKTDDPESAAIINQVRVLLLQFAFGEAPCLPDFQHTRLKRHPSGLPQVTAEYFAENILYQFQYCVDAQRRLWVHVDAHNRYHKPLAATLWLKPGFPLEKSVFDYHYIPFRHDASKLDHEATPISYEHEHSMDRLHPLNMPDRQAPSVEYHQGDLKKEGIVFGRLASEGWQAQWMHEFTFDDADFNRHFSCESPDFAPPHLRLKHGRDFLRFDALLTPGESRSLTMVFHCDATTPPFSLPSPQNGYDAAADSAIQVWRQNLENKTSADFGDRRLNEIFTALQLGNLQLLLSLQNKQGAEILQPCQGGSSERFYVWVWEAMAMLMPMCELGYAEEVRQVLAFIFSLQDSGCPPIGKFHSLDGAIGTTGPRWACTTGSALLLTTHYLATSEDAAFREKYLTKMIRAAEWIFNEVRHTRQLNADGTRPDTYGLMPWARATDGDVGHVVVISDAYNFGGAAALVRYLQRIAHPAAVALNKELQQYRHDLNIAIDLLTQPDGSIKRAIGDQSQMNPKFYAISGAHHLLNSGVLQADDPRAQALVAWQERNKFKGLFCTPMDTDVAYVGIAEPSIFRFYLRNGKWRQAWAALHILLDTSMSGDLYLTQERYSLTNRSYTPWQPNASGNGRLLAMLIEMYYLETAHDTSIEVTLLGGFMPFELRNREHISIKGLRTHFGEFRLEKSAETLSFAWAKAPPADTVIRFPEYCHVQAQGADALGNNRFRLDGHTTQFSGTITITENL